MTSSYRLIKKYAKFCGPWFIIAAAVTPWELDII